MFLHLSAPFSQSHRSASIAAIAPVPALVTACLYVLSATLWNKNDTRTQYGTTTHATQTHRQMNRQTESEINRFPGH